MGFLINLKNLVLPKKLRNSSFIVKHFFSARGDFSPSFRGTPNGLCRTDSRLASQARQSGPVFFPSIAQNGREKEIGFYKIKEYDWNIFDNLPLIGPNLLCVIQAYFLF
jgi:hypothetical protein